MPNNDSHQHVVKTSAQWNERAIEYWIVPRGCLCVELTGKGKTKIKVGEGDKNYYQLPYITDYTDLSNYYTKEEVNNLINNLEFMSIKSTEEYDSKSDLPLAGNELGDVRFVKSASPSIKIDPDVYLWNGTKWIFVGTPVSDMTQFVTKAEFNVVKDKVDEIYPKAHTHSNKEILDGITQADRDKFDDLHNYDDTEIRELIHETGHVHWNKPVLDQINQADLDKLDSLHNYDDTDVKNRLTVVEEKAHQHTNKAVLDSLTESKIQGYDSVVEYSFVVRQNLNVLNEEVEDLKGKIHYHDNIDILNYTTASYTLEQQQLLYELDAIDVFVGAGPTWNGIMGYVPAPEAGCQNYFLRGDGSWALIKATGDKYKAGEGIYILSGETTADSFPFKLYAKGGYVKQYIIYGAPGGVGEWNATTQTYHIPIRVSAEGHTSIDTVIQVRDKLYENDWINFETQEYSVYRTNLTSQFQNLMAINEMSGIDTAGNFNKPPGYWPQFALSDYYEIDPDAKYEIPEHGDHWSYEYANVNMYDADKNRTRTILRSKTSKVQIVPLAGEKYLRIASWVDIDHGQGGLHRFRDPVMYQLKDTVSPVPSPLQQIQLIPNTINTIDVLTTVKPLDMYVETVVPPDPDPDDPMSEYTGIIYNDGVLDITQEDPTNLAELTVHFRDDVDKIITIPGASVMEGATDQTDGVEGLVPAPLAGDENKFLRGDGTWAEVSGGGGTEYVAGQGIEFETDSETYLFAENLYMLSNTPINTGIMPSGLYDFHIETQFKRVGTSGFSIICYNGYAGSFSYQPGYGRSWIYNGHESWIDLYGTTAPSNSICTVDLKWGRNMTMQILPNGTYYSKTTSYDPTNVCYVILNGSGGNESYVYYVKMWDGDTLVGDLVPCVRQSDNVTGFFNKVDNTFHTNTSGPAITHGTLTGESYEIISPTSINAKLGDGLQFDTNDAIEVQPATTSTVGGIIVGDGLSVDQYGEISVDEMTGATSLVDGTSGTVPTPLASDNTKFLRGDGTWAIPSGSETYAAGNGIEIETDTVATYEDLHFDYYAFKDKIQGVINGSISFDIPNNALTISATNNYCYVIPDRESDGQLYKIPVEPNEDYLLTWEVDDTTVAGKVDVFENGDVTVGHYDPAGRESAANQQFLFTTSSTAETIHIRPYVHDAGTSLSFSNFQLYHVIYDTSGKIINAKIGNGLQFDAEGAIEVTSSGGTEYVAGQGINISAAASSEYTQVEYIKSTGTQYILTDIVLDYTMRIVLDVKFGSTVLSSAKSVKKIFGYYYGGSTNTAFFAIWLDDDADHGNLDYICFYDGFRWVQGGARTN